jgi:DNA (cytosine-5)-methyltransferase 1
VLSDIISGKVDEMAPSVVEICAGAGGEALGLEQAGFKHALAVEIEPEACRTLRINRPRWRVVEADVRSIDGSDFEGVDLFAGGVPCPPFSIAGKQLGENDERDLFPAALKIISRARPRAVMLENVPGFASSRFDDYRNTILVRLSRMGYVPDWRVLNASSFLVPQLRPRFVLVALQKVDFGRFHWPVPAGKAPTVGTTLVELMGAAGWRGAKDWALRAAGIGPTIVGGSKKHGGPDLGPTRARRAWAELSVDGRGIADQPPPRDFPKEGLPRLTLRMVARVQGFPDSWQFSGKKTAAYRQVGNAFPPPVAWAVGASIFSAIRSRRKQDTSSVTMPVPFQVPLLR